MIRAIPLGPVPVTGSLGVALDFQLQGLDNLVMIGLMPPGVAREFVERTHSPGYYPIANLAAAALVALGLREQALPYLAGEWLYKVARHDIDEARDKAALAVRAARMPNCAGGEADRRGSMAEAKAADAAEADVRQAWEGIGGPRMMEALGVLGNLWNVDPRSLLPGSPIFQRFP